MKISKIDVAKSKQQISKSTKQQNVFPLRKGAKEVEVIQLQMYLLKHHRLATVDMGVFDEITEQRVLQFLKVTQADEKLYK